MIELTSQELVKKRKQGLELHKQIHLIVSANVWRDLWMNVLLLYRKSHSLQSSAQAGISASPFPLGAFQSHSPRCWKIKTERHCFTYFGLIDVAVIIKRAP